MWWTWPGILWDATLTGQTSRAAIDAVARARLSRLVHAARKDSPFYARHLRDLGTCDAPLSAIEPVTRPALMSAFDDWATDRAITRADVDAFIADPQKLGTDFLGRYAVWTSSGSTGEHGIYVHDAHALAVYDALELVRFRRLGPAQWMGAACLAGERYAMVAATGGHFAAHATAARLARVNPWLGERARVFTIQQPLAKLVEALNAYQPSLIATYPTVAEVLADEQAAGRLRVRLHELWSGGEHLSDAVRTHIQERLGCRVREAYGASEFMPIAWECEHGGLHVNADWVLLEPVDALYRPAPPDQPSHTTLITNLANFAQPLIRYDIGDRVTWSSTPCACGSPLPTVKVEGRCNDTLAFRDRHGHTIKLLPLALATAVEEDAGVFGFQLAQTGPASLELRLAPDAARACDAPERCRDALARLLGAQGLAHVRIDWNGQAPERDAASGKLHQVLNAQRHLSPHARHARH